MTAPVFRALLPRITLVDELGSLAKNNIWGIRMKRGEPMPAARLAQEEYDWRARWFWGAAHAVPLWAAAAWFGWGLGWPLLAFMLYLAWAGGIVLNHFNRPLRAWCEYRGHECEVQAAVLLYGADAEVVRWEEAWSIARPGASYRRFIRPTTQSEAAAKLRRHQAAARRRVERREGWLVKALAWFEAREMNR